MTSNNPSPIRPLQSPPQERKPIATETSSVKVREAYGYKENVSACASSISRDAAQEMEHTGFSTETVKLLPGVIVALGAGAAMRTLCAKAEVARESNKM